MEFAFQEKTFSHLQMIADEWVRQEETAETIVPDSYPDVVQIVDSFATVTVRSKECRQGSILISGGINAGLLYMAQDEQTPRLLEAYLPFSMKKDMEDCTEQTRAMVDCRVSGVDGRILNSRKVMLRVELGCSLQAYQDREQTVYEPGQTDPRLQLHHQTYPLLLPLEVGEKLFSVEEEPELPAGRPAVAKLLHYEVMPEVAELRLAGNRAVFKGSVRLRVLYQTEDGQPDSWEFQIPFSQYCDLTGSYEEENLNLQLQLTGAELTADSQSECRRFNLSLMLLAQCVIYGHRTLETVDDAYWLGGTVQAQTQPCSLRCTLDRQQLNQTVRVNVPGEVHAVTDVQIYLGRPEMTADVGSVTIHVPVLVQLCYVDAQGAYAGSIARTQAEFVQSADAASLIQACPSVSGEIYAMPGSDGAEVRFGLQLQCQWNALCSFESICSLETEDTAQPRGSRPSVIVRTLNRDASVWQLAKEGNTTPERIVKANALTDDTVRKGTLLLLPLA